jgi:DNA polymerase-3 subunit beta
MKFSINKDKLLEGLQMVQSVVSTRTTLPVLSNVLIEAADSQLILTTTDLEVGVQGAIAAEIEEAGGTTLPAKRLFSIVREFPAGDITIDIDESHTATLRSGSGVFKIKGLPRGEFPPLPEFDDAAEFTIPQEALLKGLKRVAYASSTDETRYVLNGVYCVFAEGKLTLVATDGRRLALTDIELNLEPEEDLRVIVPSKAVTELQKLLTEEGEVRIRVSQNRAAFELNDLLLVTQLVDGRYPAFRQVIPSETKERITLERETLLQIVKRVSILANDKSSIVKLTFSENNLEISADTPEIGEGHESLPIMYKGQPFSIAFNPEFLMAPLRHLPQDEVHLEVIDGMSPGVLKVNEPFLYVIMPMRIAQ